MNAYRQQQLRAAALIEQGATAEQIAAVYGWIRGEPEQSAQTGHNQTLTPRRKCGIIKAIRRHVRHWKRKQEGNKMKKLTVALLNTAKNVLKTRVNGNKIDLYEMRFNYRGETFKITETKTPNHWQLLKLPYSGAYAFDEFAKFNFNPFK